MMDDQTVESEDEKIAPADIDLQSSFYDAIKKSEGALFDSLIQNKKVKINLRNFDNELPIFMAFNQAYNTRSNVAMEIFFRLLKAVKIEQPNKAKQLLGFKDKTLNDNGNNLLTEILSSDDGYKLLSNYRDDIPDIVTYLINEKKLNAYHANIQGNTALHLVVTHSEIPASTLKLLIDKGADVDALNEFEDTPVVLGRASTAITQEQLQVLLDYKANTDLKSIDGHDVINIGTKETNRVLNAYGKIPVSAPDSSSDVKESDLDILQLQRLAEDVIAFNADPKAIFNSDITGGHFSLDYQTPDGSTLFSIAIDYGKLEVFEFLVKELTGYNSVRMNQLPLTESHPLYYAIANYDSDPKFLQILIKEIGVKDLTKTLMNNDNSDLAPVIVWAIQNEYFSAVAELLNTKAFLEAVDKAGLFEDKQTPHTNFINMLSWQGKQVISDEEFINAVLNADSKVAYDLLVNFEKAKKIINGAEFNINDYRSNDGKSLFSIAAEVNNEEGNNDLFKLLLKDKLKDKKAPITEIEIDLVFKTDDNDSINILFISGNKNLSGAFAAYLNNNTVQAESIIKKVTDNVDTQILGALKWFGDCLNSLETGIGKVIQEEFKDDEKVQDLTDDDIVKLFPKENKVNKPDEQILKWLKTGATFKGKPLTWNSIIIDTDGLGYTPIGLAVKYGRDGTFERMSKKASKESKDGKYIDGVDISAGEVGESYTMFLILKSPPEGLEKNERKKYLKKQEKYFEYLANYTNKGLLLYAFLKLDEIGKPAVKYIEEQLEQNIEDIKVLTKSGMWKKAAKNKKFGEIILEYKELYDRSGKELELLKAYQDQAFTSFGITVPQEVIGDRITDIESIHSGELSITSLSRSSSSNKNISPKNASPSEGVVTHLRNLSIVDENREKGLTPKADFEVVVVFSDNGNEELKKVMGDNSQPGDDS